jgi:hypothetical protein
MLGQQEYLVGASPEMFVRVTGRRIETCPISGTISRGATPMEDSKQIRKLLNSLKDESELIMCSDVDRNDKSRVTFLYLLIHIKNYLYYWSAILFVPISSQISLFDTLLENIMTNI